MKTAAAASSPRYQALIRLLRTAETLWNASRVFFARWDLGPSQFNVLNLLHGQPNGLMQTDLGRQLLMHRSNVTGLVDRLEKRGLVRRADLPGDRRAYCVVLTTEGRRLVETILPHYYRAAGEVWGRLGARRVSLLVADLDHVSENAERMAAALGQQTQPEETP